MKRSAFGIIVLTSILISPPTTIHAQDQKALTIPFSKDKSLTWPEFTTILSLLAREFHVEIGELAENYKYMTIAETEDTGYHVIFSHTAPIYVNKTETEHAYLKFSEALLFFTSSKERYFELGVGNRNLWIYGPWKMRYKIIEFDKETKKKFHLDHWGYQSTG